MAKRFIPLEIAAENLLRFLHNTELALVERGKQGRGGGVARDNGNLYSKCATRHLHLQRILNKNKRRKAER